jgi:transcriptional regulator with XRE-family HTH domain
MTFAQVVRVLMDEQGLGAKELAERSGVTAPYLSKLMNGKIKEPTWAKACAIIDALGIDVDEFRKNAMEMGAISPEVTQRLAELREQKARAEQDLQSIEDGAFDVWKWAQFLQEGLSTMPDGKLMSAFVWNALVGPDDVVVTLNYDTEKSEPAQLEIERVRTDLTWLPTPMVPRTMMAASGTVVYLRFERAA